jgi:hypothetical protein
MDPTVYYQKVRAQEAAIQDEFPVLISLATPAGGRDGVQTQTPRGVAAKMIVEGEARLSSDEEKQTYLTVQAEARRAAEERLAASQVHFSVISTADLQKLKGSPKRQDKAE